MLRRGADLGHVVAQYNLGLAYKNGDLGTDVDGDLDGEMPKDATAEEMRLNKRQLRAYKYLSRAAEAGFVPAMVETALMRAYNAVKLTNVSGGNERATELLEVAASRGSWEAMYWLGELNYRGGDEWEWFDLTAGRRTFCFCPGHALAAELCCTGDGDRFRRLPNDGDRRQGRRQAEPRARC